MIQIELLIYKNTVTRFQDCTANIGKLILNKNRKCNNYYFCVLCNFFLLYFSVRVVVVLAVIDGK